MKKKIIILGSTGSIGTNTLKVIDIEKKKFDIFLLSANKNINKLFNQAKYFNCKNIIITNKKKFIHAKNKYKNFKINIYNNFKTLHKLIGNKKIYYSMISISGLDGLEPSLILSKYSKNLAIVNKESLISGWNIIKKSMLNHNVNFIPIDSEHFSIFNIIKNHSNSEIENIYITASGGPFLNLPLKLFNKISSKDALKHPNWKMGKKISIDSATMMNKVFEVIEAKNIFNVSYKKISVLIHPNSYIHAIIQFKNGLIKIIAHEPDMKIPIFNSLYDNKKFFLKKKNINLDVLNNLKLSAVNKKKFPVISLLDSLPKFNSLYETILIVINDLLVEKFLKNEISFNELINLILKISKLPEFIRYKRIKANRIKDIIKLRDYVSSKIHSLGI